MERVETAQRASSDFRCPVSDAEVAGGKLEESEREYARDYRTARSVLCDSNLKNE